MNDTTTENNHPNEIVLEPFVKHVNDPMPTVTEEEPSGLALSFGLSGAKEPSSGKIPMVSASGKLLSGEEVPMTANGVAKEPSENGIRIAACAKRGPDGMKVTMAGLSKEPSGLAPVKVPSTVFAGQRPPSLLTGARVPSDGSKNHPTPVPNRTISVATRGISDRMITTDGTGTGTSNGASVGADRAASRPGCLIKQKSFFPESERTMTLEKGLLMEFENLPSLTAANKKSILPMATDNRRFYLEGTYSASLEKVAKKMEDKGKNSRFEPSEVTIIGAIWRWFVAWILYFLRDKINDLTFTRGNGIQIFLPFQMCHESLLLFDLMCAVEARKGDKKVSYWTALQAVFRNRNDSRIVMQTINDRFDFLWHLSTQYSWARLFEFFSEMPFLGFLSFSGTENFPSSRAHAMNAILRPMFEGSWFTRLIAGGATGNVAIDPKAPAQNLAEQTNGFEAANRNQYGTRFGRDRVNKFRLEHRLPADESVVRVFNSSPAAAMVNNGCEHVLNCMANHWENMLYQEHGNFSHQRQELLNPFDIMRFHMPIVLETLVNLRGRNSWDVKVLGPFIKRLQSLNPDDKSGRPWAASFGDVEQPLSAFTVDVVDPCRNVMELVDEMTQRPNNSKSIVDIVCAGIPARVNPLEKLLIAIRRSCDTDFLQEDARMLEEYLSSVEVGIKVGVGVLRNTEFSVPNDWRLRNAIINHLFEREIENGISLNAVARACQLLTPRDLGTLKSLITNGFGHTEPSKLLLTRVAMLLKRELRREALDQAISTLSTGEKVMMSSLESNKWYWMRQVDGPWRKMLYRQADSEKLRLIDVVTNIEELWPVQGIKCKEYIPVGEAISRAQKAFMDIELNCLNRFNDECFMEFGRTSNPKSMRSRLSCLELISQIHCPKIDQAALDVLSEVKRSSEISKPFNVTPQNVVILGGGPTGLLAALHCIHNVILSRGSLKVYEKRDATKHHAAAFERAQIVRLDSRWVSILRQHLGTIFEDVFTPATGETDPHLGNVIVVQGFVEITIKLLEDMMLQSIVNLRARDLLHYWTNSEATWNPETNTLTKTGATLKQGDKIFLPDDEQNRSWTVTNFEWAKTVRNFEVGKKYDVVTVDGRIESFVLSTADPEYDYYHFRSSKGLPDVAGSLSSLPAIFRNGEGSLKPINVYLECEYLRQTKKYSLARDSVDLYHLDVSRTHILASSGKPRDYNRYHTEVSTSEPYAVCCMEGAKVAFGMHSFGVPRWGDKTLMDDIRSGRDQNTRIVGDFTKSVQIRLIFQSMYEKITMSKDWLVHFEQLIPSMNGLLGSIQTTIADLKDTNTRRERLQVRFFELGDNYYVGMELPIEFETWKLLLKKGMAKAHQQKLDKSCNCLWFESTTDVLAAGDVYNPGGKGQMPTLYTIDSPLVVKLGTLPSLEAFKTTDVDADAYEVIVKRQSDSICRNKYGEVRLIQHSADVRRLSNLSRSAAGGLAESAVALASFPVAHVISRRAVFVNSSSDGEKYISAFIGDAQASPHFMRYSGLTGAAINCVAFNNFLGQANEGENFENRSKVYAFNTNWSNGEVVQRGTGANFGQDGFLRPAMKYENLIKYLYDQAKERRAINADLGSIISRDWKTKLASAIVPRGLEIDDLFIQTVFDTVKESLFERFLLEVKSETSVPSNKSLDSDVVEVIEIEVNSIAKIWTQNSDGSVVSRLDSVYESIDTESKKAVNMVGELIECVARGLKQTVDHAIAQRESNKRISSFFFTQPLSTDSFTVDFAVEAQTFVDSLTMSVSFSTFAVSLSLLFTQTENLSNIVSAILGVFAISFSFASMTNIARYKNRNEEQRTYLYNHKMVEVEKAVFSLMRKERRDMYSRTDNPYYHQLDGIMDDFLKRIDDYDPPITRTDSSKRNVENLSSQYDCLLRAMNDPTSIIKFLRYLVTQAIPVDFQHNPYLQDTLVEMYKVLYQMLQSVQNEEAITNAAVNCQNFSSSSKKNRKTGLPPSFLVSDLYENLLVLRPKVYRSLQLGAITSGFVRQDRKWYQYPFPTAVRYILSSCLRIPSISVSSDIDRAWKRLVEICSDRQSGRAATAGLATSTTQILAGRQIQDLRSLYYATTESENASLLFCSAQYTFVTSVIFTLIRLVTIGSSGKDWADYLNRAVDWALLGTIISALLSVTFLVRKLSHLTKLIWSLHFDSLYCRPALKKIQPKPREQPTSGRHTRIVTAVWSSFVLSFMRLLANVAACVALPWSLANMSFEQQLSNKSQVDNNMKLPAYIALGSWAMIMLASGVFFAVELFVMYGLDPCLGPAVCEPFRKDIMARYRNNCNSHTTPSANTIRTVSRTGIDTYQTLNREAWEYTARDFLEAYRFDTVFGADRFGSILQYIQGGLGAGIDEKEHLQVYGSRRHSF